MQVDTQNIFFTQIGEHSLPYPSRATTGSVGYDLRSTIRTTIPVGGRKLIGTGFKVTMPLGVEGQVRSRSGLALKHGVAVLNSPGTIDSDYELEVGVILINHGERPFEIEVGDRIAQIVFTRICIAGDVVEDSRAGGFGSTGRG